MKKSLFIILATVFVAISCRNQNQNLNADVEIPVSVQDVTLKSIEEYVNTSGTAYPIGEILVKSEITANYFLEKNPHTGKAWQLNDKVRTGDLIARLEDQEYVNSLKLETSQLNLELTESELTKQQSLYEKGGVTLNDIKTASINNANAKTAVENAKLQMAKTRIIAPIDGVIVNLPYYTQGTRANTGSIIVEIMDYQMMYMNVQLPEKYISIIKPGQAVKLTNYTIPKDTIIGNITQLSPAINADTRTFPGNILIHNPNYLLRPGMYVKADIVINHKDSVIVIPKSIILSRQRGKTIFVIERGGTASERIIRTGLENLTDVEVTGGLLKNDRVVIGGFETLSTRSKVKIIK
ncbi:MAG: efflux RND transporter periplasmic adaptor subunit [Bacteroidia bacterium]|nr:efflux RND transporter periplasmic adaptor subunit [Bacteroidia bacterium]